MDAVVSGQAAALAVIEGEDCSVVRLHDAEVTQEINVGALRNVFSGASDILYLRRTSREEAKRQLLAKIDQDDALRLTLILLDSSEEASIRTEAAIELETIFDNPGSREYVENTLYCTTFPRSFQLGEAIRIAEDFSKVHGVLIELDRSQSNIGRVRGAWDRLPQELFESKERKDRFFAKATKQGVFRIISNALEKGGNAINSAILQSLPLVDGEPNFRAVMASWTSGFKSSPTDYSQALKAIAAKEAQLANQEDHDVVRYAGGYAAYQRVLSQQNAIVGQIRAGNLVLARRYMDELVAMQKKSGDLEFAARTLCKLAQEANACGQYSLQLEWAKTATELAPADPIAHGHLADAYISLNRFNEALDSIKRTEELGDERFASTERARVLRLQGRLDEALAAFDALRKEFGTSEDNKFAWNGYAEVLRDMWRLGAALSAYDEAIEAYFGDSVSQCGKAAVLTELGRLDEAKATYEQVLQREDHDEIAISGKANVLRHQGEFEEALLLYDAAIVKSPNNPISIGSRAHVLRLMRRFADASAALADARQRFPYEPAIVSETAELYRDQGLLDQALTTYRQAVARFPWDSRSRSGLANVLKESGSLAEALKTYDENIRVFPYDIVSKSGRADLLKRLGDVNNALGAYDEIIGRWPDHLGARHSKAAILVVLERFSEAEELLPRSRPKTLNEWIANHVRGMILMKTNRLDEAIAHFSSGLEKVPFYSEKKYFCNALAVAYLKRKEFNTATAVLSDSSGTVSNVLRFHALAATGRKESANNIMETVQGSGLAPVIELTQEIARRYRLRPERPRHGESWLFQKECESVLLEAA